MDTTVTPQDVPEFVRGYDRSDWERLRFAWNGQHAEDFEDANQEFRAAVTRYAIENPGEATAELLADLFQAHSEWSREAWCAPLGFEEIGALLLSGGGGAVLPRFAKGFVATFDTFGACHAMQLDPTLLRSLQVRCRELLAGYLQEEDRKRLGSVDELFEKIRKGTAHEGWAVVSPGPPAPVANIRVVGPVRPFWARVKARLKSLLGLRE